MVGGKKMIFILTITTTAMLLPRKHHTQTSTRRLVWTGPLNMKVNQRVKVLAPTTSNTISIHCGVLRLLNTFSASTQHTFNIGTVAALQYTNNIDCREENFGYHQNKIQIIQ